MSTLGDIMDRQVMTALRGPTHLPELPCPSCRSYGRKPTLRRLYVVYYRCDQCGEIWCVDKPVSVPERL
jgi:predicted RNA-binding Zn-ribbon protein involved in translation (DUF1610 family)